MTIVERYDLVTISKFLMYKIKKKIMLHKYAETNNVRIEVLFRKIQKKKKYSSKPKVFYMENACL